MEREKKEKGMKMSVNMRQCSMLPLWHPLWGPTLAANGNDYKWTSARLYNTTGTCTAVAFAVAVYLSAWCNAPYRAMRVKLSAWSFSNR
jgi:hypothetical protein